MVRLTKNRVYDLVHRTFVGGCITFTGVGTLWLGYKFINYMMFTRPIRMEEMRKLRENKLADEQLQRQQELTQQQKEAETLQT